MDGEQVAYGEDVSTVHAVTPRIARSSRVALAIIISAASVLNLVLVGSAALGMTWVLPRVAGGGFTSLPPVLRGVYGAFALLMVAQTALAWRLATRSDAPRGWLRSSALVLTIIYLVSAALNALSPSPTERWNAVPATALAVAFLLLAARRRETHQRRPKAVGSPQ